MTRDEVLAIAREGDPETMREALRQLADLMREGDPVFDAIVNVTGLSERRVRLLTILWRQRGRVVYWPRLLDHMGYVSERALHEGILRHLRREIRAHPEWGIRIDSAPTMGLKLVQTGPVPWDTGQ